MTSQIIGNNKVALFLQEKELAEHGLCKLSSEGREMKRFVVEVLKDLGVRSDGNMEIEIFSGKEGILVFAEVGLEPSVRYMVFDTLECFIEAVGVLNTFPIRSKLTYYDSRYWLAISDFDDTAEKAAMQLGEFGRHIRPDEYRDCFLDEHGEVIERDNALRRFRETFYKK